MDKISVVVPVKSEAEKIEQCLEAVFEQTVKPFEVIEVDGHSNDCTFEGTCKFAKNDNLALDYLIIGGDCIIE